MTTPRDIITTIGIATVILALFVIFRPSLALRLDLPQTAVVFVGAIALVQGFRSIRTRRNTPIDQATPPAPEHQLTTSLPGDELDERINRLVHFSRSRVASGEQERLKDYLRTTATHVLVVRDRIPQDHAHEQIARGAWTDDPIAAWYLGDDTVQSPSLRFRVETRMGGDTFIRRCARQTATAIVHAWENR